MKILLLTTIVALAAGDVSHLLNQGYQYQGPSFQNQPLTSYGAPQASVLGSLDNSGSAQSISYSSSGAGAVPQLSLPDSSGPTLSFNSGASSLSGATIQTYDNGGFSTPVPLTQDVYANLQASTPAPSVDFQVSQPQATVGSVPSVNFVKYQEPSAQSNSYQFLSKLSQPSVSTIGFNSARFGVDGSIPSGSFDSQLNSGLGFGGASSGFPAASSFDSQLNSGLGLGGSPFVSKSNELGGSLGDAFGVSTDAAASLGVSEHVQGILEPEVSKHLYFFDAPEDEEEEIEAKVNIPPVAPKKTYKIIFIKAPTYRNQGTITIPAPPPSEEKTLVYVLVKKPEKQANVRFQDAAPTKPSKPEVFFIKYKTQKEAEDAVAEIQHKHGASGQVIANLPAGQTIDHINIPSDIGSTSSSFGGIKSGGFAGDSFDSIGIRTSGNSLNNGPPPFGFLARAGVDELDNPEDSSSAQSENEQTNVKVESQQQPDDVSVQSENEQTNVQTAQLSASDPNPVSVGQQSDSSVQGIAGAVSSSQSVSLNAPASEDNVEAHSNVDSGASNQDSDSEDNESKDGSSSSKPEEVSEKNESFTGVQARIDGEPTQDKEGEGSSIASFKTYGPPNPSLFKKYGPPEQ